MSAGRVVPASMAWLAALLFLAFTASACASRPAPSAGAEPYAGTTLLGSAPDFRLVDHLGQEVALSGFLGRVVILTFMDSQCRDICPLTASHFRSVYQELSADERRAVAFLAINVNVESSQVEDVRAAATKWHLNEIASFHFLTGSQAQTSPVWEAYHVTVYPAPDDSGELTHTPGVFLIDQAGELRWYVSTPMDSVGKSLVGAPLSELLLLHIRELITEG